MIQVLVADYQSLVREGLRAVLEEASDIEVVAEASDRVEAIREYKRVRPDVAILEIAMSHEDGFETIRQLHAIDDNARILVVTTYAEDRFAARSLKAGATGYMSKTSSAAELRHAVHAVKEGRRYLSDQSTNTAIEDASTASPDKTAVECLSNRELQVLTLIARGYKLAGISDCLGLSRKTVETYRARLIRKLGLCSNAEICRFAYNHGLIEGGAAPASQCTVA